MIEKIGNLAERLATNVSESRRGFLVRAGQAALGVAGALGGLLALPGAAQAGGPGSNKGYCVVRYNSQAVGNPYYFTGTCVRVRDCASGTSSHCRGSADRSDASVCGSPVLSKAHCTF
jgi:hypothetical protein